MYHDTPLCWMMAPLGEGDDVEFDVFDNLFKHII